MGSRTATMAEVAVEVSLEEQISALELENKVLKDRLKTAQRVAEKASTANSVGVTGILALEGIVLNQRQQLRSHSDALWRRKQAISKLNARYQELVDRVPAAAKYVNDRKIANREQAEWDRKKGS